MRNLFGIKALENNTLDLIENFLSILKTYKLLGIKFQNKYEILSLMIDVVQLKFFQLDTPQLYFCTIESGVQKELKIMRHTKAIHHLKLTYIFGFYYLKNNEKKLKLNLKKVYQKLSEKRIKLINQKDIPLLMVHMDRKFELNTNKGLFIFANVTGKYCNEVLLLNITGMTFESLKQPFFSLELGEEKTIKLFELKFINKKLNEKTKKIYICESIQIEIEKETMVCIIEKDTHDKVWLYTHNREIDEIVKTHKENNFRYHFQKLNSSKNIIPLSLCDKPKSEFHCKINKIETDPSQSIVTEVITCKNAKQKDVYWQDDVRYRTTEIEKMYQYLTLYKIIMIFTLPLSLFVLYKTILYSTINFLQIFMAILKIVGFYKNYKFILPANGGRKMRIVEKRSISKLLREKLGWRFILRSYLFPIHILIQLIGLIILPILIINSRMHGSTALRTFPLSFWLGSANAFYNGGQLDPCNTENCTIEDNVIFTRFILSKETEVQKVNGHHFCIQLQTMLETDFKDKHLRSIAKTNSEILSEECTKEACEKRTIFDFDMELYPCSKVKLTTQNDRSIYFVIEDVNYEIKNEIELFFQPFKTNTIESLMSCGKNYCLKYLNKINNPVCRDDCEEFDVINKDLYRNTINTKSPFQHVMLENHPLQMLQYYNTRFEFSCNTYKSDCYSFSDNIFSFTNREGLEMTYLSQGINYWMFVLVKITEETLNLKMDILFGKKKSKI